MFSCISGIIQLTPYFFIIAIKKYTYTHFVYIMHIYIYDICIYIHTSTFPEQNGMYL